ncbi:MAG: ABC transporter substrate-binding protein [Chitinivibrionales bacterium]
MYSIALYVVLLLLAGCFCDDDQKDPTTTEEPGRIISLAPGITETIFALDAGDRLVGVTRFCTFPPQADRIAEVGGYFDPNYEAIIRLRPDLVILMKEHSEVKDFLGKKGISFLQIDNHDLMSLLESFRTIGSVIGKEKEAQVLIRSFKEKLSSLSASSKMNPRTLLVVDRSDMGTGTVADVWAAGRKTFYSDFLDAAGAQNVITEKKKDYHTLGTEGIISLRPQVIIDITRSMKKLDRGRAEADWYRVTGIPAVKDSLIFHVDKKYVSVPGPRIIHFLDDLQQIFRKADAKLDSRQRHEHN